MQSGNRVSPRTVLRCSFNTGFIFVCIRAQTIDIKPVQAGESCEAQWDDHEEPSSGFDTYHEGMDILMFSETGMVGLQSQEEKQYYNSSARSMEAAAYFIDC